MATPTVSVLWHFHMMVSIFVSGSLDKSVRVWDATTGAELQHFNGHSDNVNSVVFSHDGVHIVSGSHDNSV